MPLGAGEPGEGLVWLREPYVSLGSSGPSRVDTSEDNPEPKLPPLGFVSREEWDEEVNGPKIEPLLWEGD